MRTSTISRYNRDLPPSCCLVCGRALDALALLAPDDWLRPRPGEPVACLYCGAIALVGDAGAPRPFTDAEMRGVLADHGVMGVLAREVREIFLVA